MSQEERLDKASERLHSFIRGSAVESRTALNDDLLLIESYVSLYHAQREMRATAESQNQALQERAERAEALVSSNRNLWDECYVLRQRAEKAERERDEFRELLVDKGMRVGNAEIVRLRKVLREIVAYQARSHGGWADETEANLEHVRGLARHALSPTQETDRPRYESWRSPCCGHPKTDRAAHPGD